MNNDEIVEYIESLLKYATGNEEIVDLYNKDVELRTLEEESEDETIEITLDKSSDDAADDTSDQITDSFAADDGYIISPVSLSFKVDTLLSVKGTKVDGEEENITDISTIDDNFLSFEGEFTNLIVYYTTSQQNTVDEYLVEDDADTEDDKTKTAREDFQVEEGTVESPVYLVNTPTKILSVVSIVDDTETNIEYSYDEEENSISFTGDFSKVRATYNYIQAEDDITETPEETENLFDFIPYTYEEKERLDYLYDLFSGMDDTQIKAMANDLEKAAAGNNIISLVTKEDSDEFLKNFDSLLFTEEELIEQKEKINEALDIAFEFDTDEVTYDLPSNLEKIKNAFTSSFTDLSDGDLQLLNDYLDQSVELYDELNATTYNDILIKFNDLASSILADDDLDNADSIIISFVKTDSVDEKTARTELVKAKLLAALGSKTKVDSALESIDSAIMAFSRAKSVSEIISDVSEFLYANEIDDDIITTVSSEISKASGEYLDVNTVDSVTEAVYENIKSLSGLNDLVDSYVELSEPGSFLTSPVKLLETPSEIVEALGHKEDGEEIYITSDIVLNGNTIEFSANDLVQIDLTYKITRAEEIKWLIRNEVNEQERPLDIEALKNDIIFDITEHSVANSLDFETLAVVKLVFKKATGGELDLQTLNAKLGRFETLTADLLTAEQLNATKAVIREATIDKLYVNELEAKYAKIDFANINVADINRAKVNEILEAVNLVVKNGDIYNLNAEKIDAGTIKASALILQDDDGLYWAINKNALGEAVIEQLPVEEQQALRKSFHGDVITANSITVGRFAQETTDYIDEQRLYADKYITEITGENGIRIHTDNEQLINYLELSDGLHIYRNGNDVAYFGEISRTGQETGYHVVTNPSRIEFVDGSANTVGYISERKISTSQGDFSEKVYVGDYILKEDKTKDRFVIGVK